MKKLVSIAIFFLIVLKGSVCFAGPFGFEYGMSKLDIIKVVGKGAIVEEDGDTLILSTAPKPHSAFEKYICVISPQKGLLKVVAIGKDIETSGSGSEIKSAFSDLRKALIGSYGDPSNDFDFLESGSIWNEYQDWMMGLLKHERTLASYWQLTAQPDKHISVIALKAVSSSRDQGYLTIGYEFVGFDQYADEMKSKKDKVL